MINVGALRQRGLEWAGTSRYRLFSLFLMAVGQAATCPLRSWRGHFLCYLGRHILGNLLQASGWDKSLTDVLSQSSCPHFIFLTLYLSWTLKNGHPGPLASSVFQVLFPSWFLALLHSGLQFICGSGPPSIWIHHLAETPVLDLLPQNFHSHFQLSLCLFLPNLPLTCTMVMDQALPSHVDSTWYC